MIILCVPDDSGQAGDKCPSARAGKDRTPVALKGAALTRRPFH